MKGINKVIILGNIGNDPEMRYSQQGAAFATFSVATSERFKDKDGQQQERTEWHRCKTFGKLAEIVGQYVTKGSKVYVEGQLRTEEWTDKQGQKRSMTGVIVNELQMLDGKKESQQIPAANRSPHNPATARNVQQPVVAADDFDEDIPF